MVHSFDVDVTGAQEKCPFISWPSDKTRLARIIHGAGIPYPCLPKRGAKQSAQQQLTANIRFHKSRQRHAGVESAIGALQHGNGLKRCRDRSEPGLERYVALAVLGRNLHTLGKLLIRQQNPICEAARSIREAAA